MKKKIHSSAIFLSSPFFTAISVDGLIFAIASSPFLIHFASSAMAVLASANASARTCTSSVAMAFWIFATRGAAIATGGAGMLC